MCFQKAKTMNDKTTITLNTRSRCRAGPLDVNLLIIIFRYRHKVIIKLKHNKFVMHTVSITSKCCLKYVRTVTQITMLPT